MTLKYESEILFDLMKRDGDDTPSDVLPYESELKEKYLKQVEGAYPKLMDYRPEWLNYNLEAHLPADFPVETLSNVTSATVDNVVPYAYRSAILKGQTLVNLATTATINGKEGGSGSFINGKLRVNFSNYQWSGIKFVNNGMMKPSTQYTLIIKATNTTSFTVDIGHDNAAFNAFNPMYLSKLALPAGKSGSIKVVVTTKDDLTTDGVFYNVMAAGNPSSYEGDKFIDIELIILEGDYTNVDIPYFTGMQSVKLPVLKSTGKNLISSVFAGSIDSSTGKISIGYNSVEAIITDFIKIDSSKSYYLSGISDTTPCYVAYYDKNKNYVGRIAGSQRTFVRLNGTNYPIPENAQYIVFTQYGSATTTKEKLTSLLQLEEGSIATTYEPYKSNILTVNEDVELRGIGEVQDELNLLTGELTQRIGEVVLDGSEDEDYNVNNQSSGTHTAFIVRHLSGLFKTSNENDTDDLLSDKLQSYPHNIYNKSVEGLHNKGTNLYINLSDEKTGGTVSGLKAYLQSNPIKIQYHLSTESIKTVDLTVTDQDGKTTSIIRPIEGTMHLSTSSDTIKPTFTGEVPVEAITQNLASFIKEE